CRELRVIINKVRAARFIWGFLLRSVQYYWTSCIGSVQGTASLWSCLRKATHHLQTLNSSFKIFFNSPNALGRVHKELTMFRILEALRM
ncbi:unnamed protein product, partial [Porites lobata]